MAVQIGTPVRTRSGVTASAQDLEIARAVLRMPIGERLPCTYDTREEVDAAPSGINAALRSIIPVDARKTGDYNLRISKPKNGLILYVSKNQGYVARLGRPRAERGPDGQPTKRTAPDATKAAQPAKAAPAPAKAGARP